MSSASAPPQGDAPPPTPSATQDSTPLVSLFTVMMNSTRARARAAKETPEIDADGNASMSSDSEEPDSADQEAQAQADEPPAEVEARALDVASIQHSRKRRSKGGGGSSRKKSSNCKTKGPHERMTQMNLAEQGFAVKDCRLYCTVCNVFPGTVKSKITQHLGTKMHQDGLAKREENQRITCCSLRLHGSHLCLYHRRADAPVQVCATVDV